MPDEAVAPLPCAHGGPPIAGQLRSVPEDFFVDEMLGFDPSGAGEHAFVRVEKTGANTEWVARRLADAAERNRTPAHGESAAVGRDRARQDVDEGRLARAVRADEAMDLAGPDVEGDLPQRAHAAEALADAARQQQRSFGGDAHPWNRFSRTRNVSTLSLVTISFAMK